jgi:hypothetical protein
MAQLLQQQTSTDQAQPVTKIDDESAVNAVTTESASIQADVALDRDLRDYLRTQKRFWVVIWAALAGSPLFSFLMDTWVGASAWWNQWQGDGLRYAFGFVWFLAIFALALKHRFLDGVINSKPLVESMQKIVETDPLALADSEPVIRKFARSWDVNKGHRQAARETLERIEAAREAIGTLPIEASSPVVSTDHLPLAGSTVEPSQADAGLK